MRIPTIISAIALATLSACSGNAEREAFLSRSKGEPAADFPVTALDGKASSLQELARGKVTLLTFWAVG